MIHSTLILFFIYLAFDNKLLDREAVFLGVRLHVLGKSLETRFLVIFTYSEVWVIFPVVA